LLLSAAWVDYVQTLRRPVKVGMIFTDGSLQPATPLVPEILGGLAAAPSMTEHLNAASKLNPIYNRLRTGLAAWKAQATPSLAAGFRLSEAEMEKRLKVNLDRARVLPGDQRGRYVLVDAASARLWLFEDGEVRDTMRVVVGKPGEQTPMLAGRIRSVVLNPYWNVPPDLVRSRVAAGVLKEGVSFLKNKNYQLLSDWSDTASLLDPAKVDWRAVAAGKKELRVRQLPGPDNAMGGMKFMFPNEYGIYLHDTPEKVLFSRDDRKLSSGCVRLEDSARLARWLLGSAPRPASDAPEQLVALPQPVPIYITYLTAEWTGERFTFRNDAYRRDMSGERLAQASNGAAPDRADKAADQYADRSGTPLHHSR
jgi:murein L,D-transpeptidase YcbB/YkuD